ncbi:MAG: hypothetical protein AAF204_01265 [Pseudomonadota bacterium]
MKKINKQRNTRKIRENALKQMRETREMLHKQHPQLFEKIKKLVAASRQDEDAAKHKVEAKARVEEQEEETVHIDRKKNLEAILKYAALKPGSVKLKKELKDFLN